MWDGIFGAANLLALISWIALIVLPRWPALLSAILFVGIGLLSATYAVCLVLIVSGAVDPVMVAQGTEANFSSIEGIRGIFGSDGGVTVGWVHYLAFDLFVGLWIARDADAKFISRLLQAPILLATFLAGPLGLLIYLIVREPRARANGRWQ